MRLCVARTKHSPKPVVYRHPCTFTSTKVTVKFRHLSDFRDQHFLCSKHMPALVEGTDSFQFCFIYSHPIRRDELRTTCNSAGHAGDTSGP